MNSLLSPFCSNPRVITAPKRARHTLGVISSEVEPYLLAIQLPHSMLWSSSWPFGTSYLWAYRFAPKKVDKAVSFALWCWDDSVVISGSLLSGGRKWPLSTGDLGMLAQVVLPRVSVTLHARQEAT